MSVATPVTVSEEDFFSRALSMLEAELASPSPDLAIDITPVTAGFFDSVFGNIDLHSPTASTASAVASPTSSEREPSRISRTMRVSMKAKRYRNRKREELESLRSTVKTLEVRLAALNARPAQVESSVGPFPRVWEALAMQEAERRQAAERENEELRETVEMHMQLAQKLDQVIKKVIAHVNTNGSF